MAKKARICHMDTDSFIMHVKTDHTYNDIAEEVEKRFEISNYDEI